mmetsp:Transcript_34397/g.102950  ORF Transcript_34397/g.102950 Transcript_34397/m.102950 type:complete len:271 (+) Transcript_34397:156-968(+)
MNRRRHLEFADGRRRGSDGERRRRWSAAASCRAAVVVIVCIGFREQDGRISACVRPLLQRGSFHPEETPGGRMGRREEARFLRLGRHTRHLHRPRRSIPLHAPFPFVALASASSSALDEVHRYPSPIHQYRRTLIVIATITIGTTVRPYQRSHDIISLRTARHSARAPPGTRTGRGERSGGRTPRSDENFVPVAVRSRRVDSPKCGGGTATAGAPPFRRRRSSHRRRSGRQSRLPLQGHFAFFEVAPRLPASQSERSRAERSEEEGAPGR